MNRIMVKSSNLVSVGYDSSTHVLEVEFQTGSIYRYYSVPEPIYQGLMIAPSKGEYLHDNILNQYKFVEV